MSSQYKKAKAATNGNGKDSQPVQPMVPDSRDLVRFACSDCGQTGFEQQYQICEYPAVLRQRPDQKYLFVARWRCVNPECGKIQTIDQMKKLPPLRELGQVIESLPESDLKTA